MHAVIIAKMVHLIITVEWNRCMKILLLSLGRCDRFENKSFKMSYAMQNGCESGKDRLVSIAFRLRLHLFVFETHQNSDANLFAHHTKCGKTK